MKKTYFLKKSHFNISSYLIFGYFVLVVLFYFILFCNRNLFVEIISIFIVATLILFVSIKYYKNKGIYIVNDKVYYKNIKKYCINIEQIKGIKIIQSYGAGGKNRGFFPLKDKKGNDLYTAILLKDISDDMILFKKGDLWFNQRFKNQIIFSVVYSQEAIEYLKSLNSSMKII